MSAHGLWAVVFFSAFAAFSAVSTLIAVKGVAELRALFRHLAVGRARPGGEDPPGPEP